jgi:glycosyltransferase involved in cell wall biosynthesis
MRILHVTHQFLPRHRAGVEVYTSRLAKLQQELGHEVFVATTDDDQGIAEGEIRQASWSDLPVFRIGHLRVARTPQDSLGLSRVDRAFEAILDQVRPDVVHLQHLMYVGLAAAKAIAERGIPSVMTLHEYWLLCARGGQLLMEDGTRCDGPQDSVCARCLRTFRFGRSPTEGRLASLLFKNAWLRSELFPRLKRIRQRFPRRGTVPFGDDLTDMKAWLAERRDAVHRVLADVDQFLSPSEFLKRRFAAAGWPEERILYSPYGVGPLEGLRAADRKPARSGPLRVGFLGSLVPQKGAHVLAQAHQLVPEGLLQVSYHGSSRSDPAYFRRLKSSARMSESSFPGAFPGGDAGRVLATLDVVVVPSLWFENAPVVISEAFCAGVPVVASRLGGMQEMVDDFVSGRLFSPGDSSDLASVLENLASDPEHLRALRGGIKQPRTVMDDALALVSIYERLTRKERSHEQSL